MLVTVVLWDYTLPRPGVFRPRGTLPTVDRQRLQSLLGLERQRFERLHPRSQALHRRATGSLVGGVPMSWMMKWPGGFPVFVREAHGARVLDVDGNEYVDLCLGDTGAMTGHAPEAAVRAIAEQARRGITTMLPTEDAALVGEELRRRFGLPFWQFTLTATDANRFVIRIAREVTQRPKILVFNYCYHGSVDETFITLEGGVARSRAGNVGPPVDPTVTARVVEFNDVAALEAALAPRDVACVLAEPALTNVGIVLPEPGFHEALRRITRRTGTLLVIDETHCISAGPGGYTRAHGLEPDVLTIGKPIGAGVPSGAFGLSAPVVERMQAGGEADFVDTGGVGGTLAGNALSLAAMRATLTEVLTEEAYARMIPLAERFSAGVEDVIRRYRLPWHVTRLGCRAEYCFSPTPPRNGGEAAARKDDELEAYLHLFAQNRGVLLTPFHNMALMSPATTGADVDRHTAVFEESARALVAPG
jgi:glutamate-1-semialdehyde 2,1-aminomutase